MSSSTETRRARTVEFREGKLVVELQDGRELSVPLAWFPRLESADPQQLQKWRLIGKGEGIRWPDLDEDISVHSLLYPDETVAAREIRERADEGGDAS
ncbi:MAG: DUF2442 domain-containing protein [Gemmatimonadota bacterium]